MLYTVQYILGLSTCVCVRTTTSYEVPYELYQWIQNDKVAIGSLKKAIVSKGSIQEGHMHDGVHFTMLI